jgi:hypothetical protein
VPNKKRSESGFVTFEHFNLLVGRILTQFRALFEVRNSYQQRTTTQELRDRTSTTRAPSTTDRPTKILARALTTEFIYNVLRYADATRS